MAQAHDQQAQDQQTQDQELSAHQLATAMLQQEEEARRAARRKLEGAAKAKRDEKSGKVLLEGGQLVTPMASFRQSATTDFTVIPDEFRKRDKHGKFHVRWVAKVDQFGNPSDTEIGYYERLGYEVIRGKDGDPEKSFDRRELIAMQGPLKSHATHIAMSARPGTAAWEQAHGELEDIVDKANRKAGHRALDVVTSPHHGLERPETVELFDRQ